MSDQTRGIGLFGVVCIVLVTASGACGTGGDGGEGIEVTEEESDVDVGSPQDAISDGTSRDGTEADDGESSESEDTGDDTGSGAGGEGSIVLTQTRDNAGNVLLWYGLGRFSRAEEDSSECTTIEEGACSVRSCEASSGQGQPPEYISAGDLSITGSPAGEIEFARDDNGIYRADGSNEVWTNDTTLTFEATGEMVPAFPAFSKAIEPATKTSVIEPTFPSNSVMTIDTSSEWTVEWKTEGIDSGQFAVELENADDTLQTRLECVWDASAGSATIPASLMSQMVTVGQGTYRLLVGGYDQVRVDGFDIDLRAIEIVEDGDAEFE